VRRRTPHLGAEPESKDSARRAGVVVRAKIRSCGALERRARDAGRGTVDRREADDNVRMAEGSGVVV
jgi:hypothetical protein